MNQTEHRYFDEDSENMNGIDLPTLIASRLEDMADQVQLLYTQGMIEEAKLLRDEGLELARAYDVGTTFMFINDLTEAS
jgi:hypothetical protein